MACQKVAETAKQGVLENGWSQKAAWEDRTPSSRHNTFTAAHGIVVLWKGPESNMNKHPHKRSRKMRHERCNSRRTAPHPPTRTAPHMSDPTLGGIPTLRPFSWEVKGLCPNSGTTIVGAGPERSCPSRACAGTPWPWDPVPKQQMGKCPDH